MGCASCTDATTCTSCDSSRYLTTLDDGSKICECGAGSWGWDAGSDYLQCTSCSSPCNTCSGSGTTCTSCAAPYYLQGNNCVLDCTISVPASYGDSATRTCTACTDNCLSCAAPACTTCDVGYFDHNGACVAACPTDSITVGMACEDCDTGCATCSTTFDNCLSCALGYYLDGSTCVEECPWGQFGASDRVCTSCPGECTSCTALENCLTCAPTYYFIKNRCKSSCVFGYFEEDGVPGYKFCRECPSNCVECDSETECTSCQAGTYLYEDWFSASYSVWSCLDECKPGTYGNDATQTCDACLANC